MLEGDVVDVGVGAAVVVGERIAVGDGLDGEVVERTLSLHRRRANGRARAESTNVIGKYPTAGLRGNDCPRCIATASFLETAFRRPTLTQS